jgi:CHAT domain-containing protein
MEAGIMGGSNHVSPDTDSNDHVQLNSQDPELIDAVVALLQSSTYEDKRALFEAHPKLLTPESVQLLAQIEEIHAKRGDGRSEQGTRWLREVVEHAMTHGVEAAFLRSLVLRVVGTAPDDYEDAKTYFIRAGERFPELLRPEMDAVLQDLIDQHDEDDEDDDTNLYRFILTAVLRQRTACKVRPATVEQRMGALIVADNLIRGYEEGGDLEKLDRAIRVTRRAIAQGPSPVPWLDVLGIALKLRYQTTGRLQDVEDALAAHSRMHDLGPSDSPAWNRYEDHYALTLRSHYRATGERTSLAEAIRITESFVRSFEEHARESIVAMSNLGNMLLERFQNRDAPDNLEDLKQAIEWYRQARMRRSQGAKLPDAAVDGCAPLLDLGLRTENPTLIQEAQEWFMDADRQVQDAPRLRFWLGLNWTNVTFRGGLFADSAAGYRAALQGIRHLVFRAERLESSKRDWIRDFQWMVAQAAFALARLGRMEDAVVALESGLNLLLAERRMRVQQGTVAEFSVGPELREVTVSDVHRRLGDARAAAYIVPSPAGGVVLLVHREKISALWCPTLSNKTLDRHLFSLDEESRQNAILGPDTVDAKEVGGYIGALARWRTDAEEGVVDDAVVGEWDDALRATCSWLWDAAVSALAQQIRELEDLELLLIPVGRLSGLPLHAAFGTMPGHERGAESMLIDFADVTYAPSVTVLPEDSSARLSGAPSIAAVADTHGLQYAGLEAELAAKAVGLGATYVEAGAGIEAVRALLREHPIWHFACHSDVDMALTESGRLVFEANTRVRIDDLLAGVDTQPMLVTLSACTTGAANLTLLTESINLASDFIGHGARRLIASAWPVNDAVSCAFMIRFYDVLPKVQWNAARALRDTQRWARDCSNAERVSYIRSQTGASIAGFDKIGALADALEQSTEAREAYFKWWAAFFAVGYGRMGWASKSRSKSIS